MLGPPKSFTKTLLLSLPLYRPDLHLHLELGSRPPANALSVKVAAEATFSSQVSPLRCLRTSGFPYPSSSQHPSKT